MDTLRTLATACLLLGATAPAFAQSPGLLGFNLGARLEADECPKGGPGVQFPPVCATYVKAASWRGGPMADHYQIMMDAERMPSWAGSFFAVVSGGVIVELTLFTRGAAVQAEAYEAASAKFGKADRMETKTWLHRQHGTVRSLAAQWRRPDWQLTFEGVVTQLETGLLVLSKPAEQSNKPSRPL